MKRTFNELPLLYQSLMLDRQVKAGNPYNPGVFIRKIDASKAEGGFNFTEDKEVNWNRIWDKNFKLSDDISKIKGIQYKGPEESTLTPEAIKEEPYAKVNHNGEEMYLLNPKCFNFYITLGSLKSMERYGRSKVIIEKKS